MELIATINSLKRCEESSAKKGYMGDATEYAFRRQCLLLLKEVIKTLKEDTKHKKYLWQTLEEVGDKLKE